MPEQQSRIPIAFPIKGLDENWAFDQQPPETTRDLLNVRAIDPKTSRTRGAQRSGLSRWLNDSHSGAAEIQEMISVFATNNRIKYDTSEPPTTEWSAELPDVAEVNDLRVDEFGSLYAAGKRGIYIYNADGNLIATILTPELAGADPYISCFDIDPAGNVYIASNSNTSTQSFIYGYERVSDTEYLLAWTLEHGTFTHDLGIYRRADAEFDLYILDATAHETGTDQSTASRFRVYREVDIVTGPTEDLTARVTISQGNGFSINSRMAIRDDGVAYVASLSFDITTRAKLSKCNPNGDASTSAVWEITGDVQDIGGIGIGVAVGPRNTDGDYTVYTYGPSGYASDSANIRRIVDTGTSFDAAGTDAWGVNLATEPASWFTGDLENPRHYRARLAVDKDGRLYVPYLGDGSPHDLDHVLIYETDGTELNSFICSDADGGCRAVAVPKTKPNYPSTGTGTGGSGTGIEETELVYLGTRLEGGTRVTLFAERMVIVTQSPSSRVQRTLAMGGGNIELMSAAGSFSDPVGGTGVGVLDSNSEYVAAVVGPAKIDVDDETKGRSRVYITDGRNYKKYDPVDDAVSNWECSTQGDIPPRCRLIEFWQGRVVLAGDPENPAAWHMSAIANPEDWDNFRQVVAPDQAISGVNARAGDCPDIVTAMVPWDDDLLIFGGDHTIWRMDGNPMAGGQFSLVTDQTGMAFGRPWAREPGGGAVYFMSNQCGVYALQRGGGMIRLTRDRIERRLQDAIDFSTHYVRLAWNYRDEGLHIFQCPFGGGGTSVKHWFWDRKNDAWFEDQFGTATSTTKQPTAVYVLDGDAPTDRVLLLGCEDGRVRVWDRDSPNDDYATATDLGAGGGDDLAIDSYVTMGPIQPRNTVLETQFSELRVWLARDQDGVRYDVFVDDEPDFDLDLAPVAGGALVGGHNPTELVRFTGDTCWVRLRNASSLERWAFERATIAYAPAGVKRS